MGKRWRLALLAPLLLGAAPPDFAFSPDQIKEYVHESPGYRSYPDPLVVGWEGDLRQALAKGTLDQAVRTLAPKYGLSPQAMLQLAQLTIAVSHYRYASLPAPAVANARRRLLASSRTPLVLGVVAGSLDDLDECKASDFTAMMAGSADPAADAWRIAENATCGDNYLHFTATAPARAMPGLIRLADYGSLGVRLALPLYAWLTSDAALARIDDAARPALSALLYRRYLSHLFDTGLTDRAVALFEGLPAEMRTRILDPHPAGFSAVVDGLPLRIKEDRSDDSMMLDLAAAYAVAGRTADAEALYKSAPDAAKAQAAFACSWEDRGADKGCKDDALTRMDWVALDHLLHHQGDDPYPLAEVIFSGGTVGQSPSGPIAEMRCKVFTEGALAEICNNARDIVASNAALAPEPSDAEEDARNQATLATLAIPGFAENRAAIAQAFAQVRQRYGYRDTPRDDRRASIPAPVSAFERPLPAAYRGARGSAPAWPAGMTPLPDGFSPVRVERKGNRAVAISVSQNYDPTGEITPGGYWAHLSDDGGKTWHGYYTGLAASYPYVVAPASSLPLLGEDALDIQVDVFELDTASITYPPVGLRTRRKARDLYLHIPLAELTRDSDGDGITDIAAHHLLLDRAQTDGGTPFVVGTTPAAQCTAPPSAERRALATLMEKLFSVRSGALIEPIDRAPGLGSLGLWGHAAEGRDRPILIKGDPRDYACLHPDRLMIVYGDKDIEQLQRATPDFHTIELPRIVYNRAHDRGYVQWSTGWAGGTYRLKLVRGEWVFDGISSWIT